MHGIEALLARRLRSGDELGCLARGLVRDLLQHVRSGVEALDQLDELVLEAGDAGKLRLGAAKFLTHFGKLLLDRSEIVELRRLPERLAELARDLVEACVQRLDGIGRHYHVERMLESLRHVDKTLVDCGGHALTRRKVGRRHRIRKVWRLQTEIETTLRRRFGERREGAWARREGAGDRGKRVWHVGHARQRVRPAGG